MIYLVIITFFIGVLFSRFLIAKQLQHILNTYLIYIGLPTLIFVSVSTAPIINIHAVTAILLWIILSSASYFLFCRSTEKKAAASAFFNSVYSNMGYFGIPLAFSFFGATGAIAATMFVVFEIIIHNTLGIILAQRIAGKKGWMFLKTPFLWAVFVAIIVSFFYQAPQWLAAFAKTSIYLTPFVVGLAFSFGRMNKVYWKSSIIKFILSPLLFFIAALIFNQSIPLYLLLGFLPPATSNVLLAIAFKYDEKGSAAFVSYATAAFLVVLGIISFFVI